VPIYRLLKVFDLHSRGYREIFDPWFNGSQIPGFISQGKSMRPIKICMMPSESGGKL
jgi:hypothetical protein